MIKIIDKTRAEEWDYGMTTVFTRLDHIKRARMLVLDKLMARPDEEPYRDQAHLWDEVSRLDGEIAANQEEHEILVHDGCLAFVCDHWEEICEIREKVGKSPRVYDKMKERYDLSRFNRTTFAASINYPMYQHRIFEYASQGNALVCA